MILYVLLQRFHPFYYHPGSTGASTGATTAPTAAHHTQASFLAHPNLLLTSQTATSNNPNANTLAALSNGTNAGSGLFDLSSQAAGYNAHMANFNSNRQSPFDNSNHLANQNPFFPFNAASLTTNLNNQAALNSILKTANPPNYFALPQHLTNAFQTQLQDRL